MPLDRLLSIKEQIGKATGPLCYRALTSSGTAVNRGDGAAEVAWLRGCPLQAYLGRDVIETRLTDQEMRAATL